jgi:hypothetical protein
VLKGPCSLLLSTIYVFKIIKITNLRPDTEKHLVYQNILFKPEKQLQVEEEINQVKDPIDSKKALERVTQAEALKPKSCR